MGFTGFHRAGCCCAAGVPGECPEGLANAYRIVNYASWSPTICPDCDDGTDEPWNGVFEHTTSPPPPGPPYPEQCEWWSFWLANSIKGKLLSDPCRLLLNFADGRWEARIPCLADGTDMYIVVALKTTGKTPVGHYTNLGQSTYLGRTVCDTVTDLNIEAVP